MIAIRHRAYRMRQRVAVRLIKLVMQLLRLDCVQVDDARLTVIHVARDRTRWVGRVEVKAMIDAAGNVLVAAYLDEIVGALIVDALNRRHQHDEE